METRNPLDLFNLIPDPMRAAILAAIVALLRIIYDDHEPQWARRILESSLCGAIALGAAHLVAALGMPSDLSIFLGGSVGLFGADQVREWGRRVAEDRLK